MNPDRPLQIAAFLERQGWQDSMPEPIAGDFSSRHYARLTRGDGSTAILMDADADQKTPQFVALAALLRSLGVTAPEIYAADAGQGLVLMEDFGGDNIGSRIDAGEAMPSFLLQATEILARLHAGFDRTMSVGLDLPLYNTALFVDQVELFLDTYFRAVKKREAGEEERRDFRAAWEIVLRPLETMPKSLLLRDFMPDNLMQLPDNSLGVLDFQDAGIGPVAYDLASLCETVRRDDGFAHLPDIVAHYRETSCSPLSQADLMRACTILSAQRHMRILGIVTGLALQNGRRDKLDYLPRIRRHLASLLKEGYLLPVQQWVTQRGLSFDES